MTYLKTLFFHQGRLIESHRKASGLSQLKISQALGFKNGQFISNVERGKCLIPHKKAKAVCGLLNIRTSIFLEATQKDLIRRYEDNFSGQCWNK